VRINEELLELKLAAQSRKASLTAVGNRTLLPTSIDTNFTEKLRSFGQFSSLAD
jgi:hypothetical protein